MKVFTDEWKQTMIQRYERLPKHNRPYLYFVATREELRPLREEIEEGVAALSPAAQVSVISKLRSPKNFIHTSHELTVGRLLRRLGYEVEYERSIGGFTPDWYVHPRREIPAFVFEVFTAEVSEKRRAELRASNTLWGWLREIPVTGVALHVTSHQTEMKCDDKRGKEIARHVRRWLSDGNPPVGSRLDFDDFSFEVINYNPDYTSLQLLGPGGSFMVNKEPVRINFKEKIRKYREVLRVHGLALVIGVIADFMTGVSFDSFIDLLWGSEAVNYLYNESTGVVKDQRLVRLKDGLFHREPALSAAAWVSREGTGEWQIRVIHNPHCVLPLPATTFPIV